MTRLLLPAIPPGAGAPPAGSLSLWRWPRDAPAARLLSFPSAPDPHARGPRRCDSWSGGGLAQPRRVRPAIGDPRQGPVRIARKVAPDPPRFRGRARATAVADGWPPSGDGRPSRKPGRPGDVWT